MQGDRRARRALNGRADAVGDQFVVGAAQDDGPLRSRGVQGGRGGDRGVDRRRVGVLTASASPGQGTSVTATPSREVADQAALVGAARGGGGGPDRDRPAARRGGLDRGHRTDDRQRRFQARPAARSGRARTRCCRRRSARRAGARRRPRRTASARSVTSCGVRGPQGIPSGSEESTRSASGRIRRTAAAAGSRPIPESMSAIFTRSP